MPSIFVLQAFALCGIFCVQKTPSDTCTFSVQQNWYSLRVRLSKEVPLGQRKFNQRTIAWLTKYY